MHNIQEKVHELLDLCIEKGLRFEFDCKNKYAYVFIKKNPEKEGFDFYEYAYFEDDINKLYQLIEKVKKYKPKNI